MLSRDGRAHSESAAAQLREGRPALAAFLEHLPVLEMPDVGHRLLRHALDLALLLARAVGLDREDAVHLGAQAHVLQDPGGEGLVAQLAHHLDGLGAPRCRERAQVPLGVLGLAGHEEGGAVQVRLGHGVERVLQLEDLHHHGVGVREEQPHLREEPPHVEVVGLLHHELGELQRAGTVRAPTWVGTLMQALLRSVLSVSTKARNPSESLIWSSKFVTELLPRPART